MHQLRLTTVRTSAGNRFLVVVWAVAGLTKVSLAASGLIALRFHLTKHEDEHPHGDTGPHPARPAPPYPHPQSSRAFVSSRVTRAGAGQGRRVRLTFSNATTSRTS